MCGSHLRYLFALALILSAPLGCGDDEETTPQPDVGSDQGADVAAPTCPDSEFGCVEVASGAPIHLATLLAVEGDVAFLGVDEQRGVELALDYLDGTLDEAPGQLLGHPIELTELDSGCSADIGEAAAETLAADSNIVAVVGTSCSGAGVPAAEVLSEVGILLVSPSNTAPSLTHPDTHQPFYARTAHNDNIQGAAVARFAAEELEAETAATIHDGDPYTQQIQQVFADNFEDEHGGTVTAQVAIDPEATDFTTELEGIATDSPDVLYYPIFLPAGGYITTQARTISGFDETDLIVSDGMLAPEFIDAAGADAEGVYASGPELRPDDPFYEDDFLPAYEAQYGEEPSSPFHVHAFDAFNLIVAAIEDVAVQAEDGSLLIPRTQLRDAFFATSGYDGLAGTLTCDANGDCNPDPKIVVFQVQSGAFELVWPTE